MQKEFITYFHLIDSLKNKQFSTIEKLHLSGKGTVPFPARGQSGVPLVKTFGVKDLTFLSPSVVKTSLSVVKTSLSCRHLFSGLVVLRQRSRFLSVYIGIVRSLRSGALYLGVGTTTHFSESALFQTSLFQTFGLHFFILHAVSS